jgi:hypothetical protein
MAAVLMSNPLHLAVLGNPLRKRRISRKESTMAKRRSSKRRSMRRVSRRNPTMLAGFGSTMLAGNPRRKRRAVKRRSYRRNPGMAATGRAYVGGLTGTPARVMNLFKGKNAAKNTLFAAGGLVGTYLIGGMVSGKLGELFSAIPGVRGNIVGERILPALVPYTIGFAGSRFIKDQNIKAALLVGGGVASIIELLMPGQVGNLVSRLPGFNRAAAAAPVIEDAGAGPVEGFRNGLGRMMLAGLGRYVDAPAYSGTAGLAQYVDAPAYAGTAGLAQYVDAPAYAGTAGLGQEMLAGNFLEDSSMFQPSI